jgi:capsular polysaccharide biosynthesis protein
LKTLGYAILENARVITGSEFVFKGGIAYKQDYDFSFKLKDVNYALFYGGIVNNSSYLLTGKFYHSSKTIDKAIYLSGSYTKNWYHWMIEILPKLIVLKRDLEDFSDFKILVSEDVIKSANHKSALLCFVEENKIIYLDKKQIHRVNALIYVDSPCITTPNRKTHILSSTKDGNFYYSLMKDLKDHLTAELLNLQYTKGSKRIYLYREQLTRRFNQKEVLNLLKRFDFSTVDTGQLSLKQQAELFNGAEIIVGATGAAWTNLLFCSKNTKAVIFWPDNFGMDSRFPNLANLSGVDLYSLEFKNPEKDWVTYMKSEKEAYVNIENLDQQLKSLTL